MKLLFEIEKLSSSKLCGKRGGDEYIFEEREKKAKKNKEFNQKWSSHKLECTCHEQVQDEMVTLPLSILSEIIKDKPRKMNS